MDFLKPTSVGMTQPERSIRFMRGIQEARDAFAQRFEITRRGLSAPQWGARGSLKDFEDLDDPITSELDLAEAASKMEGSRDLANTLFCALLRSAGVVCRLVCSLQPLIFASSLDDKDASKVANTGKGKGSSHEQAESEYPIYWVEYWNIPIQRWLAVEVFEMGDLKVQAFRFEPPLTDRLNRMVYVMAFESDGSARDVTRRYARTMSSRTRKLRVDSITSGELWWGRVLKIFERQWALVSHLKHYKAT